MADAGQTVKIGQLFRTTRGTPLGDSIQSAIERLPQDLREPAKDFSLEAFVSLQGMHQMPQVDLDALKVKAGHGLPFFIQNGLNDPEIIPNLRPWQVRFWKEAILRWNPPQWNQLAGQVRLLQHACTGAGKSDIIAMAPFAGARERCLVLVPTNAILEDLKVALGAPQQGNPNQQPDEQAPTKLRSRGLLSAQKPLPVVFVLPGTTKDEVIPGILASHIVLTTPQTLKNRLKLLLQYMRADPQNLRWLFDLMITDEAHHYPAATWIEVARALREATPAGHAFNELLLTATPHHYKFGNLDDDAVRDEPQLTPYTLLDGMAEQPPVVKGFVFLEIQKPEHQRHRDPSPGLQALMLAGDVLRHKMGGNPSMMHRALAVARNVEHATDLLHEYNALPLDRKPRVLGRPMVVAVYHGKSDDHPAVPESVLLRFRLPNQPDPVHLLIQCSKLSEGYDQPTISVVAVCMKIGLLGNKFAQFSGRGGRNLGAHNLEAALVPHLVYARDNMAHIVTHSHFQQLGLWDDLVRQQGNGAFDANAVSDDELADEGMAELGAEEEEDIGEPPAQHPRNIRLGRVDRYVMAPTEAKKNLVRQSESAQYDGNWSNRWEFTDKQ